MFVHDATDAKLQEVLGDSELLAGASSIFIPSREHLSELATKTLGWVER